MVSIPSYNTHIATYDPIATITLTSAQSSVTFSNITQEYKDLVLRCNVASSGASSSSFIQVNDDTGTNYSSTLIYGTGSAAGSNRTSSTALARSTNRISNPEKSPIVYSFMSYANTNIYKSWLVDGSSYSNFVERSVVLWRSTSAISSIKIFGDPGINLLSGSKFSLYGIRGEL